MTGRKFTLIAAPAMMMVLTDAGMSGMEQWFSRFGTSEAASLMLGQFGICLPYMATAAVGVVFLFASAGSANIRWAACGVLLGGSATILIAMIREVTRRRCRATHKMAQSDSW